MTTTPTDAERRALAFIWADVEPGLGLDSFGPSESGLTAEALFGDSLLQYRDLHRPTMRALRPHPDGFRRESDGALVVCCEGAKNRRYEAHLVLNQDGSVAVFALGRAVPPGLRAREARPDEYEQVAELLRDSPVVTGDRSFSIWLRRLPDALAMQRHASVVVVERESDGRLLAARASGRREAVCMGQTSWVGQAYQAGVLPEARGQGLENAIILVMMRAHAPHTRHFFGLVDVGNVAILQAMGGERVPVWRHTARQIGIAARPDARSFGRAAASTDAPRLLEMLVGAHGRKEWRPPFDLEWIRRRFETVESYRWDAVRMTDQAFVALWPAGDVVADVSSARSLHARFAYLADYGFIGAAGLRDFARLVEDARRRSFAEGCTHAVAYTCDASAGSGVLASASDFDDRMYLTIAAPEPGTVADTGVYVDSFFA